MFSGKVDIQSWIQKVQDSNYKEVEVSVSKKISTREWLKSQFSEDKDLLPLVIIESTGAKRPFRYDDHIDADEKIIYIE